MLDPLRAEKIAKKYLLDKKTTDGDFFFAHTQGVVSAVKILSKRFKLNEDKMVSRAWVHDIGYFLNDMQNHADNSLKILKEEEIYLDEVDEDCILNHGNGKNPYSREGKIMQIADKISILNEDFLEILLSKKKVTSEETNFIKMMCEKAILMLNGMDRIEESSDD